MEIASTGPTSASCAGDRIQSAGNMARLTFDNPHAWLVARPLDLEQARQELTDLVVVALNMAEDLGFDVVAGAVEKSSADIQRGER
jgi:hypothetical protein